MFTTNKLICKSCFCEHLFRFQTSVNYFQQYYSNGPLFIPLSQNMWVEQPRDRIECAQEVPATRPRGLWSIFNCLSGRCSATMGYRVKQTSTNQRRSSAGRDKSWVVQLSTCVSVYCKLQGGHFITGRIDDITITPLLAQRPWKGQCKHLEWVVFKHLTLNTFVPGV